MKTIWKIEIQNDPSWSAELFSYKDKLSGWEFKETVTGSDYFDLSIKIRLAKFDKKLENQKL